MIDWDTHKQYKKQTRAIKFVNLVTMNITIVTMAIIFPLNIQCSYHFPIKSSFSSVLSLRNVTYQLPGGREGEIQRGDLVYVRGLMCS